LDLAVASLYFQVRQNSETPKQGYNKYFSEWDQGNRNTPNWGETLSVISKQSTVSEFNRRFSCDVLDELRQHFAYLCNFTHSRPYGSDSLPANTMNMGVDTPSYDQGLFDRVSTLTEITIGWICIIWLVAFPAILKTAPLGTSAGAQDYQELLALERGKDAFLFASS